MSTAATVLPAHRARSAPGGLLAPALALVALTACKFTPDLPTGAVVGCFDDSGCPVSQRCRLPGDGQPGRCCRGDACAESPRPPPLDAAPGDSALDAASPHPQPAADASRVDMARPDAAPGVPLTCDRSFGTNHRLPGERAYCAIFLRRGFVGVGISVLKDGDPVSVRGHNGCWAAVDQAVADPESDADAPDGGADAPPVSAAPALVELVTRLQQACEAEAGQLVGGYTLGGTRGANLGPAALTALRTQLGLDLAILDEQELLVDRYRASARGRRGRIVLWDHGPHPEIIAWPADAATPLHHRLAIGYDDVGRRFLNNPQLHGFSEVRRALRAELRAELGPFIRALKPLIADGRLPREASVGPTWPVVPMAAVGLLRDQGGWPPAEEVADRIWNVLLDFDDFGWNFGVLAPRELDRFLSSLTAMDLVQLRWPAIRYAYGETFTLGAILVEVLAADAGLTRFGYVQGHSDSTGFILRKLTPAL